MGRREAFAPEEWARIVGAPMLAGIAVTAADPGGVWGAVKESMAVAGALQRAKAPTATRWSPRSPPPTRPPRAGTWRAAS